MHFLIYCVSTLQKEEIAGQTMYPNPDGLTDKRTENAVHI